MFSAENFFGRKCFSPKLWRSPPRRDARSFDHFKKFARKGKFFEMLSWGGLGGAKPPQESPLPVVRRSSSSSVVVIALMLPCCRKLVPTDFRYRAPSLGLATIQAQESEWHICRNWGREYCQPHALQATSAPCMYQHAPARTCSKRWVRNGGSEIVGVAISRKWMD